MFVIEDERHAEWQGQFHTLEAALDELKRRAAVAWDQAPNQAPCTNWKNCGRTYEVVEYDESQTPWKELSRRPVLDVSADAVRWYPGSDSTQS